MSEGKGEGRAVPPEPPRVPIIFTACLFVFWQTAQVPGLMAASEQAATCCPYGSESRPISGCWADKEADQWLAVGSRGLLHPGNSPWWLLSTVQGSVFFRVGPFVMMPAGDGEVPWGSGLKPKKDKVGLLRGDLGNGAAGQGLRGQLKVWVGRWPERPAVVPMCLLPALLLGPQGQTSGSAALILPRCSPGNGSPPCTWTHPTKGRTSVVLSGRSPEPGVGPAQPALRALGCAVSAAGVCPGLTSPQTLVPSCPCMRPVLAPSVPCCGPCGSQLCAQCAVGTRGGREGWGGGQMPPDPDATAILVLCCPCCPGGSRNL